MNIPTRAHKAHHTVRVHAKKPDDITLTGKDKIWKYVLDTDF